MLIWIVEDCDTLYQRNPRTFFFLELSCATTFIQYMATNKKYIRLFSHDTDGNHDPQEVRTIMESATINDRIIMEDGELSRLVLCVKA